MASFLTFCDTCSEKRVREVRDELEQLVLRNQVDVMTCGICCCKISFKTEIDSNSLVGVSTGGADMKHDDNEALKREMMIEKTSDLDHNEVSTSKQENTENPDVDLDDVFVPSDLSDNDSDAVSNYSDELESKDEKPKSTKKKKKKSQEEKDVVDVPLAPSMTRKKLLTTDLNPEFIKEVIFEGSLTAKDFACKICQSPFKFNGAMMKKFISHLGEHKELNVPKTYRCPLCEQCFVNLEFFKKHVKDHTDPTYYECTYPDCDRKFKHKKSIKDHVDMIHKGLEDIKKQSKTKSCTCHICGVFLVYGSSLKQHLLRHQEHRAFKCDECGKSFIDKQNLNRHRERHETKSCMCETCGKTFILPHELKTHSITHTDERIYQCEFCPYRAKRLGTLRNHIKTIHTEADPNKFKCNYCGLNFLSATACTKHEKKHQTGVDLAEALLKPYQCSECGFRARKPCKIRLHMRSHTGEKPFKCLHCEKPFTMKSQCKRHMTICKKR